MHSGTVKPERHQEIVAPVHKPEIFRKHADDLAGDGIGHDAASDDFWIATESALPISITDHDDFRTFVLIVFLRKFTPKYRMYAEHRKQPEGQVYSIDPLGVGELGDSEGPAIPDGDVGECPGVLAISHVVGNGGAQILDIDTGRRLPDA